MARSPPPAGGGVDTPALDLSQPSGGLLDGRRTGRLRLRTLIALRWLALAGQTVTVLFVGLVLDYRIPLTPCLLLIGASAWLNVLLSLRGPGQRMATEAEAVAQLAFDMVQLAGLLMLTGGAVNPFALLMIAPATLAAAALPGRQAAGIVLLAAVLCLTMSLIGGDLPLAKDQVLHLPGAYRVGAGVALVAEVVFTAACAWMAASEAARMELALNMTQAVLAREQRLSALGALAAAAAHELGTPLATITIIAREMERSAPDGPAREDALMLVGQAERCREILRGLAEQPDASDQMHERMSLLQFLNEVIEPHAADDTVRVEAVVRGARGVEQPDLRRLPEVIHAMTSFVENAVDFARSEVLVSARFDAATLSVEVRDDGPGFSPDILARLGEPYVTSRPGAEGSRTGHIGMGLGFFIAKTLLERTGATVQFRNGQRGGALVSATWPRGRIEALTFA